MGPMRSGVTPHHGAEVTLSAVAGLALVHSVDHRPPAPALELSVSGHAGAPPPGNAWRAGRALARAASTGKPAILRACGGPMPVARNRLSGAVQGSRPVACATSVLSAAALVLATLPRIRMSAAVAARP